MNAMIYNGARSVALVIAASWAIGYAHAQEAGAFDQFLSPDSTQCVQVSAIEKVAKIVTLSKEQFQFARALYVAIPPISKALPPGDHAIMATTEGAAMIAMVDGSQACARFLAPDFILKMLSQIEKGENAMLGTPL